MKKRKQSSNYLTKGVIRKKTGPKTVNLDRILANISALDSFVALL